ncbi:hypothetical protein NARC_60172 [Candidatus Nitrosocosmicus arcticus]|uniref:Uncharacterized protein n=1 Tax=Candidatus Nitrosocosmicus arcticus TaxID=2035267 RepID=A0A557SW09_9ARCH|nr:hypothetical protein NARC_60172 [Candidatus Nitrosocosmicus arcticus]
MLSLAFGFALITLGDTIVGDILSFGKIKLVRSWNYNSSSNYITMS